MGSGDILGLFSVLVPPKMSSPTHQYVLFPIRASYDRKLEQLTGLT